LWKHYFHESYYSNLDPKGEHYLPLGSGVPLFGGAVSEIQEFCRRYDISEEQYYGRKAIRGSLDLRDVAVLPDGFNPRGLTQISSRTLLPRLPKGKKYLGIFHSYIWQDRAMKWPMLWDWKGIYIIPEYTML
jgi:hypothetical protein